MTRYLLLAALAAYVCSQAGASAPVTGLKFPAGTRVGHPASSASRSRAI